MDPRILARGMLGAIALHELGSIWERSERRRELMRQAETRAQALGRPLVVFRPDKSGPLDRALESWEQGIFEPVEIVQARAAELSDPRPRFADDAAVVFVACVLEYVDDAQAALNEIFRIAGDVANIYIVTVQPWTFYAQLHPRAKWVGLSDSNVVALGRITPVQRGLAAGILVGLAGMSLWPRRKSREETLREQEPPSGALTVADVQKREG